MLVFCREDRVDASMQRNIVRSEDLFSSVLIFLPAIGKISGFLNGWGSRVFNRVAEMGLDVGPCLRDCQITTSLS